MTPQPISPAPLHAGFWRRVAAYLLDSLVLLIPSVLAGYFAGADVGALLQLLMWAAYKVALESGPSQATLGKRWMGIKVTDAQGQRIGVGRAIGRFFGSIVSTLILGLGFVLAGFTAKRQALHDLMSSTFVVRVAATPEEVQAGAGTTMPMTAGVWVVVVLVMIFPFFGGILAAVAIPAYADYLTRVKIVDALNEGTQLMSEVQSGQGEVGKVQARSRDVDHIVVDRPGRSVRIVLRPTGASGMQPGATITLKLENDASTSCSAQGVHNKWLPPRCRR